MDEQIDDDEHSRSGQNSSRMDMDLDEENDADLLSRGTKEVKRSLLAKKSEFDVFEAYAFAGDDEESSKDEQSQQSGPSGVNATSETTNGDHVCVAKVNLHRQFVCVDYPAVIKNKDKALATLGGLDGISKTLSGNLRMEMNFRPKDPYCKSMLSSEEPTSNLLIKVKRRRAASGSSDSSVVDGFEYQVEVLGFIERTIKFNAPSDFQFLPVLREKGGGYKEILSIVTPSPDDTRESYMSRPAPLFLPPILYCRRELPAKFSFEDDLQSTAEQLETLSKRKGRSKGTIIVTFTDKEIPSQPLESAKTNARRLCSEFQQEEGLKAIRKLFDERPIWTKAACLSNLDPVHRNQARHLLPVVAYHFSNGPWIKCWVRLGFDPRKLPETKIYQCVDFRIRHRGPLMIHFERKRPNEYQMMKHVKSISADKAVVIPGKEGEEEKPAQTVTKKNKVDLDYMFFPDKLPPYKQMLYQICDIHDDEVHKKAHENDGQETVCTERDGWCIQDFTDVVRDMLSLHVVRLLEDQT